MNTLARRLQVCADMAGDKHDVEDRLAKLQVLQQQNTKLLCNFLLYQNHITFDSNTSLIIVYQICKWKKNCECLPFHALLLKHLNIFNRFNHLFVCSVCLSCTTMCKVVITSQLQYLSAGRRSYQPCCIMYMYIKGIGDKNDLQWMIQ